MSKPLIEDSYKLSTSDLKLRGGSCEEPGNVLNSGILTIVRGKNLTEANYWIEQAQDELYLMIGLTGEPKRIRMTVNFPNFGGERYFFECPSCGRRCEKLYLAPDSQDFKCHKHFIYEATTINRQSIHGQFLYRQNRLIKLVNQRTDINRIWYNDNYTKRFCRWLKMCARAGMANEAEDALDLLKQINSAKLAGPRV
jgi:hypothetical protein